jgi:hypothetical protein
VAGIACAPLLLVLIRGLAPLPPALPSDTVLRISGTNLVPKQVTLGAIGVGPGPGEDLDEWSKRAIERIVAAYHERGYSYARAWFSSTMEPGTLWFYVDEGVMRVTFVGVGGVEAFFYRLSLNLPGSVFHHEAVERALDDLQARYELGIVYYRVRETDEDQSPFQTPFAWPELLFPNPRVLQIYVSRAEYQGLALDLLLSATWGLVPSVSYRASSLWLDDDRARIRVQFAFPYRRYFFEESPRLRWIHGGYELSYRLPRFPGLPLAPRIDSSLFVSRYQRLDLDLDHYFLLRGTLIPTLALLLPRLELSLGVGADLAWIFRLEAAPDAPPGYVVDGDHTSLRTLLRLGAVIDLEKDLDRRDRRTFLALVTDFGAHKFQELAVKANLSGQWFGVLGRHRAIVRARALTAAGAVPFWDEVPLAGDYQHVFFDNLYWVHHAMQVELAYRVNVWRYWFELGFFHDLSVFGDRTRPGDPVALANAFGPSLHFLLFDLYALDIQQGLGFAPGRFDQTFSLTLQTIF